MKEIRSPEEIPEFASEAEEAEFWATHCFGESFPEPTKPWPEGVLPPARPCMSFPPGSDLAHDPDTGEITMVGSSLIRSVSVNGVEYEPASPLLVEPGEAIKWEWDGAELKRLWVGDKTQPMRRTGRN